MKNIITIVLFFISLISFGQSDDENQTVIFGRIGELTDEQLNNSGPSKLTFVSRLQEAKKLALMDIENETPFLLLMGGIAPVIISTDPEFELKYGVYFYEFGCTGPDNDVLTAYNEEIFKYLTAKNGKKWIKEVREDVVGLKAWRKK